MLIKNTSQAARGLYTANGIVDFAPGETREVEISKEALEDSSGWFEAQGKKKPADEPKE